MISDVIPLVIFLIGIIVCGETIRFGDRFITKRLKNNKKEEDCGSE